MALSFREIFGQRPPLIAMIHLKALPGTPAYAGNVRAIIKQAAHEAKLLDGLGVDALLIENMHDTPYLNRQVGPEINSTMTAAALAVRAAAPSLPCGIQVLAGANETAMAIALAADLQFIRAEGFVFSHVADEGMMNSDAATLLRYRKNIGADHIAVFTDIKKKHSAHTITQDVDLAETAKAAVFFRTDGMIITGTATGAAAQAIDVKAVKEACPGHPVLIGSGISPENISDYSAYADGFIVGSYLKQDGHWAKEIDPDRVKKMVKSLK